MCRRVGTDCPLESPVSGTALQLTDGGSLEAAVQAVQNGTVETVIILENDLYRRADAATVQAFLEACQHVIVIDHLMHTTAEQAEVIFFNSLLSTAVLEFALGTVSVQNQVGR